MSGTSGGGNKVDFKQLGTTKKIESPLAKYNSAGQLTCIICDQVVKSELVWNAHINSKTHLDNKNKLKSKLTGGGETTSTTPTASTSSSTSAISSSNSSSQNGNGRQSTQESFKRPAVPPPSTNKDLLKRIIAESEEKKEEQEDETNTASQAKRKKMENLVHAADSIDLNKKQNEAEEKEEENGKMDTSAIGGGDGGSNALPAGFFDDPDEDARVRGSATRAQTLEAEYEEFKRTMQTEEFRSDLIVEHDDALRDVDRDIVEADELIERWTRIEQLHQKREALKASAGGGDNKAKREERKTNDDDEDDDEIDLDSAMGLALRSKNIC